MTRWPKRPLGVVAKFVNGRAFKPSDWSSEGLPIIRIQNLTDPTAPANRFKGPVEARYLIRDGDLLVSWSATLDVFNWNRGNAILNQHIFNVVPDPSQISKVYLFYALKSVMDELRSKTHGTTMKHITKGPFERTEIPVPPLAEQERLGNLLEDANTLRKLRIDADRRTNDLIPALFHEMFGDPTENPNRWPIRSLDTVVAAGRIVTYGIVQAGPNIPDGVPYIRTGDMKNGGIQVDRLLRTSSEIAASYRRSEVMPNDIVMSIRATVGTTAVVPEELRGANLTQGTARISPGTETLTEYLLWFLRMPSTQSWIQAQVKGATFREITLGSLRQLPVLIPPLSLQKEFAQRVAHVHAIEVEQSVSRRRLGDLFQSMLHRAFTGEL